MDGPDGDCVDFRLIGQLLVWLPSCAMELHSVQLGVGSEKSTQHQLPIVIIKQRILVGDPQSWLSSALEQNAVSEKRGWQMGQIQLAVCFVNKVLLERSHTHLVTYRWCCFLAKMAVEYLQQIVRPTKSSVLYVALQGKFAALCFGANEGICFIFGHYVVKRKSLPFNTRIAAAR